MNSDWIWALIGGGLIGLAAALFLLVNGRIMGASGLVGGLVDGSDRHRACEQLSLIAGLVAVPAFMVVFMGGAETNLTSNWAVIIVSGLLVGVGTRIANGCTSGHGVCGISRRSIRGMVATVFYIGAGAVTVLLFKHVLGFI